MEGWLKWLWTWLEMKRSRRILWIEPHWKLLTFFHLRWLHTWMNKLGTSETKSDETSLEVFPFISLEGGSVHFTSTHLYIKHKQKNESFSHFLKSIYKIVSRMKMKMWKRRMNWVFNSANTTKSTSTLSRLDEMKFEFIKTF